MKHILLAGLVSLGLSSSAQAETVTLDFDTVAGGSNIVADGSLNTSVGLITLFEETPGDACIGCVGTFPTDLPFATYGYGLVEAGSTGSIGLDFDFDVQEITLNFGGDGGGFEIFALNAGGVILDSLIVADLPASGLAPGPLTLNGPGIRFLRYEDPVAGGGASIDNVMITASAVPEPSTYAGLLGITCVSLLAYGWRRKRQQAA